jgi:hypothetical protein
MGGCFRRGGEQTPAARQICKTPGSAEDVRSIQLQQMADQASRVRKPVESTLKHNTFDLCYLAEGQAGLREQLEAEARGREAALAALAVANKRLVGTKARVG